MIAVSRRSTGSLLKTHPGLGKLDVHHSSIVGRCPARTNVRFGSNCEKLNMSKYFPVLSRKRTSRRGHTGTDFIPNPTLREQARCKGTAPKKLGAVREN